MKMEIINILKKYFTIFFTKYIMCLKENKEYKVNLYSALMFDFVTLFVFYLFLSVFIGSLAGDILVGWRKYDYILYYFLLLHAGKGVRFFFLQGFSRNLLNGVMNIYLSKPVNPYFFSAIQTYRGANALTYPLLLMIIICMIFMFDYTNYILGFFMMFFGLVYYITFYNLFASLAF
ncbi:MAG: hypothetical protein JXM74_04525, partial [Fusobacteriaceae bacterium]|nr:hypothetical protein [Fusobacteriaceae bacterium]